MGDYDPIEHGPSVDYLRDFDFAPSQSDDLLEKIMEIHRTTLKGQAPAEAGQLGNILNDVYEMGFCNFVTQVRNVKSKGVGEVKKVQMQKILAQWSKTGGKK